MKAVSAFYKERTYRKNPSIWGAKAITDFDSEKGADFIGIPV